MHDLRAGTDQNTDHKQKDLRMFLRNVLAYFLNPLNLFRLPFFFSWLGLQLCTEKSVGVKNVPVLFLEITSHPTWDCHATYRVFNKIQNIFSGQSWQRNVKYLHYEQTARQVNQCKDIFLLTFQGSFLNCAVWTCLHFTTSPSF